MGDTKVHDLSIRRREQIQKDPIMRLADRVLKELVGAMDDVDAAGQLVSLDLAFRATTQAITHALGEVELNQVMVEFEHRRQTYSLAWPEHDQSRTVYDGMKLSDATVVSLRSEDDT